MKDNSNIFEEFPDHSRIWLYQSNRALNGEEMNQLEEEITKFTEEWASHGDQLMATAKVLNPYFSIVAVNDANIQPSGCSVDVLMNLIKQLGAKMNINFLDRMKITIKEGEELKQIDFSDLSNHKEDTLIYDPMVSLLGEFRNEWPIPIEKSRYNQLVG